MFSQISKRDTIFFFVGQDEMQFDMGLQEPITIKTDDEDDEEANEDSSEDEDRRSKFLSFFFNNFLFY